MQLQAVHRFANVDMVREKNQNRKKNKKKKTTGHWEKKKKKKNSTRHSLALFSLGLSVVD